MTIETEINNTVAECNGATTVFPFNFKITDSSQLIIERRVIATGIIDKTYSASEVTITGVGDATGGSVTITPALAATYEIILRREVNLKQELDIVNEGGFFPETVEQQLDTMTMQIQQIASRSDRALVVPIGETLAEVANWGNGEFIVKDASGNPVGSSGTGSDAALRTDLATAATGKGLNLIAWNEGGTDALDRTVYARVKDLSVSPADYGVAPHTAMDSSGAPTGTPTDQSPFLLSVADRVSSAYGGGTVKFKGPGILGMKSSIVLPFGVTFDFGAPRANTSGTDFSNVLRVMPLADGAFYDTSGTLRSVAVDGDCQDGILFWCNIDPAVDPATWIQAYAGAGSGGIDNLSVDGQLTGGISVAKFAGSHRFTNWRLSKVAQAIRKPNLYTDSVHIEDIYASYRANNTDYLIYLQGLGDNYYVKGIAAGYTNNQDGICYGTFVQMCRGGLFLGYINGINTWQYGTGLEVIAPHVEGGQLIFDGCQAKLSSGHLHNGRGHLTPIIVKHSNSGSRSNGRLSIEGTVFAHHANDAGGYATGDTGWATADCPDIDIQTSKMRVIIGDDNARVATFSGNNDRQVQAAPQVAINSTLSATWKYHSPMLASQGSAILWQWINVSGRKPSRSANWTGITADATAITGGTTFQGATGTRRYFAWPVQDFERRIVRAPTSGTPYVSIAVTNGSATLPAFYPDAQTSNSGAVLWEVYYSSTDTDSYDFMALVPLLNGDKFYDNGNACNTFAWTAVSPAKTLADILATGNNNGFAGVIDYNDGIATVKNIAGTLAGSNPNVNGGIYTTGDQLWYESSSLTNNVKPLARVCRSGGTYGTSPPTFDLVTTMIQSAKASVSDTTDGSGDVTVTHGLGATPSQAYVTVTGNASFMHAQVHTKGSSTFKVRFFDAAGAALTATAVAFDWWAS